MKEHLMQTTIILEAGSPLKILFIPESDTEKAALREFKVAANVKIEAPADGMSILGKTIPDAIIISIEDKK